MLTEQSGIPRGPSCLAGVGNDGLTSRHQAVRDDIHSSRLLLTAVRFVPYIIDGGGTDVAELV